MNHIDFHALVTDVELPSSIKFAERHNTANLTQFQVFLAAAESNKLMPLKMCLSSSCANAGPLCP